MTGVVDMWDIAVLVCVCVGLAYCRQSVATVTVYTPPRVVVSFCVDTWYISLYNSNVFFLHLSPTFSISLYPFSTYPSIPLSPPLSPAPSPFCSHRRRGCQDNQVGLPNATECMNADIVVNNPMGLKSCWGSVAYPLGVIVMVMKRGALHLEVYIVHMYWWESQKDVP